MRNVHFWTDDKVAEMRKLLGERMTFAEVAARIGAASRNTIASKAYALGITSKVSAGWKGRWKKPAAEDKPLPATARRPKPVPQVKAERPVPTPPDCAPVTLLDRQHGQCAFPVSGNGVNTLFCAAGVDGVRHYCRAHLSVMWARAA